MDVPELILITWNRHHYLQKTLEKLMSDPADFRLYCWDNASGDETRDLINDLKDERIVEKHFHPENVNQTEPCLWFFNKAESPYIGKIDDDILLPAGWTERLADALGRNDRFGMLGCWMFMEKDWDEEKAKLNTREVSGMKVLHMTGIAGHSFLGRREVIQKYISTKGSHGLPVDRPGMSVDGYISGILLPPMMAHNMDDPRSPHCIHFDESGNLSALTARMKGFDSVEAYAAWIAQDAHNRLTIPIEEQIERIRRSRRDAGLIGKIRRHLRKYLKRSG